MLGAVRERLATVEWDAAALEEALRQMAEARGVGVGKIFQPMRVALTGVAATPGIFDVLVVVGRARTLARLDAAVAYLSA